MRYSRWDQLSSDADGREKILRLARKHLAAADEGSCVTVIRSLVDRGDYRALCDFELRYEELDPRSAYHLRQVLAFFSKRADINLGVDRSATALSKFESAETLCWRTNDIFRRRARGEFCFSPRVEAVLHGAQRKIARILGDRPSFEQVRPRFGPGATTQVRKSDASARSKLGQVFACSAELAPVAQAVLSQLQQWVFSSSDEEACEAATVQLEIHPGRVSCVPKNAKTDRVIVVEPMLNSMFQLGYGDFIAKRLARFGQSTKDQSRNQRLALLGSIDGSLATLDLSSASDTIATELVFDLLPADWAHTLSRLRTGMVEMPDGRCLKLEKFSSMGNGFTFPLETLIFYALASACVEGKELESVSVYGDDIIIPAHRYELLVEVLNAVGFIPNPAKSFASGPFRESCGKDYLSGSDIRPFYLKDRLSCETSFSLHNFYVRRGELDFAAEVRRWFTEDLLVFGPDGYGDGHLLGTHLWTTKATHASRGYSGYCFDTFTHVTRESFRVYKGDRVLPSYTVYASPPSDALWDGTSRSSNYLGIRTRRLALNSGTAATKYDGRGRLGVTTPGSRGYKRISVYVLSPS